MAASEFRYTGEYQGELADVPKSTLELAAVSVVQLMVAEVVVVLLVAGSISKWR